MACVEMLLGLILREGDKRGERVLLTEYIELMLRCQNYLNPAGLFVISGIQHLSYKEPILCLK